MGSQSNVLEEIEVQTLGKIKELNASYSASMESVINELLSIVCDVKPEIHVNYRIRKFQAWRCLSGPYLYCGIIGHNPNVQCLDSDYKG